MMRHRVPRAVMLAAFASMMIATVAAADFPRRQISLDLRDADVRDVLWAFAKEHQLNLIIGEDVHGKVTLSVHDVPVRTAFNSILDNAGLTVRRDGSIMRVNTFETVKKQQQVEPLVSRVVSLSYFPTRYGRTYTASSTSGSSFGGGSVGEERDDLDQLKQSLEKHLSGVAGSSITIVPRTNSLVITDISSNVDRIVEMAKALDVRTPQVLIEAKIVEIDASTSRELGITTNFNAARTVNTEVGGGGSSNFSTSTGTVGGSGAILSELGSSAFDFFLRSVGAESITNLQIILTAAEQHGLAKTLGTPRVATLNNKEAIISSGQRIPFTSLGSVAAQGGTNLVATVQFVDAALELAVTPHVTADNNIMMKVRAARNTADFDNTVFQNPTINTREAINEVLVPDGQTVVIGGIYIDDSTDNRSGTPFLMDIPVIGHLFKNTTKDRETRELIFLITPHVVRDAAQLRASPATEGGSLALGQPAAPPH
jgi:type IV pilus assembly protein PilQ